MSQENLVGLSDNQRDLRAERRDLARRDRELEEIGQGEGDREGDSPELYIRVGPQVPEGSVPPSEIASMHEDRYQVEDEQQRVSPQPTDPWQLILQQMQAMQISLQTDIRAICGQIEGVDKKCKANHKQAQTEIGKTQERLVVVESQVEKIRDEGRREREDLRKNIDRQVVEMKSTVEQLGNPVPVGSRFIDSPRDRRIPEEMKFNGRCDRPLLFLKDLKASLGKQLSHWESARETIKMYMIGAAREWFTLNEDAFVDHLTFENLFRRQYWSPVIQSNLRRRIENGHYDPRCGYTPNEYLLSQRLLSTQFSCYEDELMFVMMIARHYDNRIQEAQINGGIVTLQRFSDILEAYHAREEFQASMRPRGFYANPMSNRNWSNEGRQFQDNNQPPQNNFKFNNQNNISNFRNTGKPGFQNPNRFPPNNANQQGRQFQGNAPQPKN